MTEDQAISIELRNGRMEAVLLIQPGLKPGQLTSDMCLTHIHSEGVALTPEVEYSINELVDTYNADPSQTIEATISQGRAPQHGKNGYLEWTCGFDSDTDHPDTNNDSDEPVDYYQTQTYITAHEGQHIATVIPPTNGTDGITVEGTVIQSTPGKQYKLRSDTSISINEDGRVLATRSGLLWHDGNALKILDMLNIEGYVDFSTGHINFDGNVTVQKGIRDRFHVNCTGDLHVRGLIDVAEITTGRDAVFERGMAAREKGTISIGRDLTARYLDNVNGTIHRDLFVEKEIVNCNLQIGRTLCIERGALVGGETVVGASAEFEVIGSDAGVRTQLSIGVFPKLEQAVKHIQLLRGKVQRELSNVQYENDIYVERTENLRPHQRERLTELQLEIDEYQRRITLLDAKESEIQKRIKQYSRVDLKVTKRIYPGVIIVLQHGTAAIRTDIKGPIRIHLNDHDQPIITDLTTGTSMSLSLIADVEENEAPLENDSAQSKSAA